jgi:ankyrin repeat protein
MSDALPLPPRPRLDYYKHVARDLQRACKSQEPGAIRAWAKRLAPTEQEAAAIERRWRDFVEARERAATCLLADVQFFIAREHGFASWPRFAGHIEGLRTADSPVARFEAAVDAIVGGDTVALKRLLRKHPELARARSTREHRSSLLHYVSANGVEDFRQKTPKNIVEITKLLLDAGADVNAESDAYGGGCTAIGLVGTSIHPEQAGVQIALLETLMERGAFIEKPGVAGNRHTAVAGCLANGQPDAARFFAERGARLDLEAAAGIGRLDVVRTFFDNRGLTAGATREQVESGFLYACGYGHADVVRFLLEKGVDPGVHNNQGETGLHWTTYGPHLEIARMLMAAGAPRDARDAVFDATPLDWARYALSREKDPARRENFDELIRLISGQAPR